MQPAESTHRVLIFHQTAPNLRHASIEPGIEAIREMGADNGFTVEETQESTAFTDANLSRFDAVVWLNTIGVVFDESQRAAFKRYVTGGGGWVGVHGPAGQEINWRWYYDELVAGYLRTLPRGPGFPEAQEAIVRIEDRDHPSTAHLPPEWKFPEEWWNFYENPRHRVHVLATLDESSYRPGFGSMGDDHPIAWCHRLGSGRAWYTNLGHSIESYADEAFRQHLLGGILYATGQRPASWAGPSTDPDSDFEQVLLAEPQGEPTSLAVLPDGRVLHTSRTGEVWLTTPDSTTLVVLIPVRAEDDHGLFSLALDPDFATNSHVYLYYAARDGHFQLSRFTFTGDTLDLGSEQPILRVPVTKGLYGNPGGGIGFDAAGDLLLAIGDNDAPFAPGTCTPDAEDPRGKLVRIKDGRPEILTAGLRNPVRFAVDRQTGRICLGDHGDEARFYLIQHGQASAWISYSGDSVPAFGTRRAGQSPMGGPTYRFDAGNPSSTKFPEHYDGRIFVYERERGWIREIEVGPDGEPGSIKPFLHSGAFGGPVDLEFGADGALFVLDRATGLSRIDYARGNRTPVAVLTPEVTSGGTPLEVTFHSLGSHDPSGGILSYAWDFTGDGEVDLTGPGPVKHTYTAPGRHTATLTVTTAAGRGTSTSVQITAGATTPSVTLETPVTGQFFESGSVIPYQVTVAGPEVSDVAVGLRLGRMVDGHPVPEGPVLVQAGGSTGDLIIPALPTNRIGVLTASCTTRGDLASTGVAQHVLQPRVRQAASFDEGFGVRTVRHPGALSGWVVADIDPFDWIKFDPVNLAGITGISVRVAAAAPGGTIEVQSHVTGGPLVHSFDVPDTGGLDRFVELTGPVTDPGGTEPLYFVFRGPAGGLFTVDTVTFHGS